MPFDQAVLDARATATLSPRAAVDQACDRGELRKQIEPGVRRSPMRSFHPATYFKERLGQVIIEPI